MPKLLNIFKRKRVLLQDVKHLARTTREAIPMEHPGTFAFNTGLKALDKLSSRAEKLSRLSRDS